VEPAVFEKILIANRGEIASRIIRICMRIGVAAEAIKVKPPEGNPVR